jgi:ABC-type antimicrobial peptide transport system permease subunit
MFDLVLLLSLATVLAIFIIAGYLGYYAYRHIKADTIAAKEATQAREK